MPYDINSLQNAIRDALLKGIQRNGDRILDTTLNTSACFHS